MAITIEKIGGANNEHSAVLYGKSTDTKPVSKDLKDNDIFIELDTGDAYFYDNGAWQLIGG